LDVRRFIQKQNLHVSFSESVIKPPSNGPATEETPYALDTIPTKKGLFLRGMVKTSSVRLPQNIPLAPTPAIALPMIRARELGAVAHMIEPASKIARAAIKVHLTLNKVYILPKDGCSDIWVSR
jgi:hypothetical protein